MKKLFTIIIFLFSILLYLATIKGITGNPDGEYIKKYLKKPPAPFELSPERGRYAILISLVENKSISLSKELADVVYPDVGIYQGKYYAYFTPGVSILALPFYHLGKIFGLPLVFSFSTSAIFSVLNMALIILISRKIFRHPFWISLFSAFTFAFASTAWSYAITLYQHQITTFFILSTFYLIWYYRRSKKYSLITSFFIWFNYAAAIIIDYPNAVLMLPLMIYFFISSFKIIKKRNTSIISLRPLILASSIVFFLMTFLHGYYNYVNFGDWKRLSGDLAGYKPLSEQNLLKKEDSGEFEEFKEEKQVAGYFKEDNLTNGLFTLLFSMDRGLFIYSPIYILGFIGIFTQLKSIDLTIGILLSIISLNFLFYASFIDPWGGWAFGPRYLIPSMAVLSIFIGRFLARAGNNIITFLFTFILFSYSSAISLLGAITTNAIPLKIEGDLFHWKYNFLLNLEFLYKNQTSSYVFNTYFRSHMSLVNYYLILFILILTLSYFILFLGERVLKK